MPPTMKARTCVVICHWTGQEKRHLYKLLSQMMKVPSGSPFSTLVVANGGDEHPIEIPPEYDSLGVRVIQRENTGYNIAAWDVGWRSEEFDYYLFLQSECFLKREGWISEFEFRMDHDTGLGLIGEAMMWDRMSWPFIRRSTDRDLGTNAWPEDEPIHPIDFYQQFLDSLGIPRGETGEHIQTLVLFTSRNVLDQIGGFPIGLTYREAVSCEIGTSRLIASNGYRIAKVKDSPWTFIGHYQWTRRYEAIQLLRRFVSKAKSKIKFVRN